MFLFSVLLALQPPLLPALSLFQRPLCETASPSILLGLLRAVWIYPSVKFLF